MENFVYPLGSVVAINNGMEVFIISYGNKKSKFEYYGCLLLEGFDYNKSYRFNNDNILYPIFIGYNNEELKEITKDIAKEFNPPKVPFLPIGSVVKTKDFERVMITGFAQYDFVNGKYHDYSGITYNNDLEVFLEKDEIVDILFVGMQTEESIGLSYLVDEVEEDIKNGKNVKEKIKKIIEDIDKGGS